MVYTVAALKVVLGFHGFGGNTYGGFGFPWFRVPLKIYHIKFSLAVLKRENVCVVK